MPINTTISIDCMVIYFKSYHAFIAFKLKLYWGIFNLWSQWLVKDRVKGPRPLTRGSDITARCVRNALTCPACPAVILWVSISWSGWQMYIHVINNGSEFYPWCPFSYLQVPPLFKSRWWSKGVHFCYTLGCTPLLWKPLCQPLHGPYRAMYGMLSWAPSKKGHLLPTSEAASA